MTKRLFRFRRTRESPKRKFKNNLKTSRSYREIYQLFQIFSCNKLSQLSRLFYCLEYNRSSISHNISTTNIRPSTTPQQHHHSSQFAWHIYSPSRISLCLNIPRLTNPFTLLQNRIHISRTNHISSDPIPRPLSSQTTLQ